MPAVCEIWAPVQNARYSGMVPLIRIVWVVLAATVPRSIEPPVVSVDAYVASRTYIVWFAVVGLVTPVSVKLCMPLTDAAEWVIYGWPLLPAPLPLVFTNVHPVKPPLKPVSVTPELVTSPVGIVQLPVGVVQY